MSGAIEFAHALLVETDEPKLPDHLKPLLPEALRSRFREAIAARLAALIAPSLRVHRALRSVAAPSIDRKTEVGADEWREMLEIFPGLTVRVKLLIGQSRAALVELLERLRADAADLHTLFGLPASSVCEGIEDIQLGLSDPHRGGRQAAVITLSGGKIVYKPKSLDAEQAWRSLCQWLQRHDAPYVPVAPDVLDCGTHGWARFIEGDERLTPEKAGELYFNLGNLLAVLYALGTTDCHRENLVIRSAAPVLVDMETLMQPRFVGTLQPASIRESVLATELLPARFVGPGGQNIHFPGFGAHPAVCNDAGVRPERHLEQITDGFAAMYGFLLKHREALLDELTGTGTSLSGFRQCHLRFVYRSTMTYGLVLGNALARLASEDGPRQAYDRLRSYEPVDAPEVVRQGLRDLEQSAFEQLDIPYFGVGASDTLLDPAGSKLPAFSVSAFGRTIRRIETLSQEDCRHQLDVIAEALGPNR